MVYEAHFVSSSPRPTVLPSDNTFHLSSTNSPLADFFSPLHPAPTYFSFISNFNFQICMCLCVLVLLVKTETQGPCAVHREVCFWLMDNFAVFSISTRGWHTTFGDDIWRCIIQLLTDSLNIYLWNQTKVFFPSYHTVASVQFHSSLTHYLNV